MPATKVGNLKTNSVTIDQLMSFFKFNLIFSSVAHFHSTIQCCFAFSLYNIVAMVGFIHQNPHLLLRNLSHTARDCKVFELFVCIGFFVADGNYPWNNNGYKWFVAWKNSNLAIGSWKHNFVNFLAKFDAKQSN